MELKVVKREILEKWERRKSMSVGKPKPKGMIERVKHSGVLALRLGIEPKITEVALFLAT